MKTTTNLTDIFSIHPQLSEGKTIITATIGGRTVRVNSISKNEETGQHSIRVSHNDWPNAQYFDVEDGETTFHIYTESEYAALLNAIKKK